MKKELIVAIIIFLIVLILIVGYLVFNAVVRFGPPPSPMPQITPGYGLPTPP